MYKNSEGYVDPTAGSAMNQIKKEYRQKQKNAMLTRNTGRYMWLSDMRAMWTRMSQRR